MGAIGLVRRTRRVAPVVPRLAGVLVSVRNRVPAAVPAAPNPPAARG